MVGGGGGWVGNDIDKDMNKEVVDVMMEDLLIKEIMVGVEVDKEKGQDMIHSHFKKMF